MAKQILGSFPNMQQHRIKAGLEISDLVTALGGKPGERSLRRLENGGSIRMTSVNRIFNILNDRLGGILIADVELKQEK